MHSIFQPILKVDQLMHAEVNAYEMLIRNAKDKFPGKKFLQSLTTEEGNASWIRLSEKSLERVLSKHPARKIYINLEPCQMKFANVWHFLAKIHALYNHQVAVEVTERRETIHNIEYLDEEVRQLKSLGFEIAIDDVCAGSNSYSFIVRQLNVIDRIKLSLLVFNQEDAETTMDFVNAWLSFATKHNLDFVLEGVSNRQVANYFAGRPMVLQQGYYWGKGSSQIED